MTDVLIKLPDETAAFLASEVARGAAPNVDDYVANLVQQQQRRMRERDHLEKLILEGINSGPGREWTPAVMNEIREKVLARRKQKATGC